MLFLDLLSCLLIYIKSFQAVFFLFFFSYDIYKLLGFRIF